MRKRRLHLPQEVRHVVTAAGATLHGTCKSLEEVVLLRAVEENVSNHGEAAMLRGRRSPFRSVPKITKVRAQVKDREIIETNQVLSGESRSELDALRGKVENLLERLSKLEAQCEDERHESCLEGDVFKAGDRGSGQQNVMFAIDAIYETIKDLEVTMSRTEEESLLREQDRRDAATLICAVTRGFLQRKIFFRICKALQNWKLRHGGQILRDAAYVCFQRHEKILESASEFHSRRREFLKGQILSAWAEYVHSVKPWRNRTLEIVEKLCAQSWQRTLETCLHSWHEIANGSNSRKMIQRRYQERYARVEARLRDQGKGEVLREEDVLRMVNEDSLKTTWERKLWYQKKICFAAWREIMQPLRQKKQKADRFFANLLLPLFFESWKAFVLMRQEQARVAFVWDPNRFDTKHNDHVVENFARRHRLQRAFLGWKQEMIKTTRVRKRLEAVLHREVRGAFEAWEKRASFQKQVKMAVIREWQEIGARRREIPFRAWYIYTRGHRRRLEAQNVLLSAFKRRKHRLTIRRFFRQWKHKAIYGKAGGLHTRAQLFEALETQKRMILASEIAIKQQRDIVEELRDALAKEKEGSGNLHIELSDKKEEIIQHRFAQQQLEAEIVRLQSLFDSISLIHPGTAKRIVAMNACKNTERQEMVSAVARRAGVEIRAAANLVETASPMDLEQQNRCFPSQCEQCGFNPLKKPLRPQSARRVVEEEEEQRESCGQGLVWVSKADSEALMRSRWAQNKIKQLANRARFQEELNASATEMEMQNLRAILAFIFAGDHRDLRSFEPDLSIGNAQELNGSSESMRLLRKANIHSLTTWNEFLQSLEAQFPLLHPQNDDPRKALNRRIANLKDNERLSKWRQPTEKNNIYRNTNNLESN